MKSQRLGSYTQKYWSIFTLGLLLVIGILLCIIYLIIPNSYMVVIKNSLESFSFVSEKLNINNDKEIYAFFGYNMISILFITNIFLYFILSFIFIHKFVRSLLSKKKIFYQLKVQIFLLMVIGGGFTAVLLLGITLVYFYLNVELWLGKNVDITIEQSINVAEKYFDEHKKNIQLDALAMRDEIDKVYNLYYQHPEMFSKFINNQARVRGLSEAFVFRDKEILAKTNLSFSVLLEKSPTEYLKVTQGKKIAIIKDSQYPNRVRAIVRLNNFIDTYLLIGRFVDQDVVESLDNAKGAQNKYELLKNNIISLKVQYFLVFLNIVQLLIIIYIILATKFSFFITRPLNNLIISMNRFSYDQEYLNPESGDNRIESYDKKKYSNMMIELSKTKLPENRYQSEIVILQKSFNNMIDHIVSQQQEIVYANKKDLWTQIAKRVAHEIKNPLTPIMLIRNKIEKNIDSYILDSQSKEDFLRYINLMFKHIDNIEVIIRDFTSFMQMPESIQNFYSIDRVIQDVIDTIIHDNIQIITNFESNLPKVFCDNQQIFRVILNLLKNSVESLSTLTDRSYNKKIEITTYQNIEGNVVIEIFDNGIGFSEEILQDNLLGKSNKKGGMGLGLIIVKQICDDNNIQLKLSNSNGAHICLTFYNTEK